MTLAILNLVKFIILAFLCWLGLTICFSWQNKERTYPPKLTRN